MPDLSLKDRLPSIFPTDTDDTEFSKWLSAHQSEIESLNSELTDIRDSFQIRHAEGKALRRIGEGFGILGRRRGRKDGPYRHFLMSLTQAYQGRGTPPGLRTAIAAGILSDSEDVELIEDFENQKYEIVLKNASWSPHTSGTIRELAELADPSVVEFREPVHNYVSTASLRLTPGSTTIRSGQRLQQASVVLSPKSASKKSVSVGLSSDELRGISTDDWILSTISRPSATVLVIGRNTQISEMSISPIGSISVGSNPSITRPMTRLNPARTVPSPETAVSETISNDGLSSNELPPLSSSGSAKLST